MAPTTFAELFRETSEFAPFILNQLVPIPIPVVCDIEPLPVTSILIMSALTKPLSKIEP